MSTDMHKHDIKTNMKKYYNIMYFSGLAHTITGK